MDRPNYYTPAFRERFRYLRDQALLNSPYMGQRRKLGKLSFGTARAEWRSEDDGRAVFTDTGLRNQEELVMPGKTELMMYNSVTVGHEEAGKFLTKVTFFRIYLDIGTVSAHNQFYTSGSSREYFRGEFAKRRERKHQLDYPTDEELDLLYSEMLRGASGLYPYDTHSGDNEDYFEDYEDGDGYDES